MTIFQGIGNRILDGLWDMQVVTEHQLGLYGWMVLAQAALLGSCLPSPLPALGLPSSDIGTQRTLPRTGSLMRQGRDYGLGPQGVPCSRLGEEKEEHPVAPPVQLLMLSWLHFL